jgi:tetratricopeptide (TPR) repeat protein
MTRVNDAIEAVHRELMNGRVQVARTLLDQVLKSNSGHPLAMVEDAYVRTREGEVQQALAQVENLVMVHASHYLVLVWGANLLLEYDRLPAAEAAYRRAAFLNPASCEPEVGLACIAMSRNHPETALARLDEAEKRCHEGNKAELVYRMFLAAVELGDQNRALLESRRILQLDTSGQSMLKVVEGLYWLRLLDEAGRLLREYGSRHPEGLEAIAWATLAYFKNKLREAAQYLAKAGEAVEYSARGCEIAADLALRNRDYDACESMVTRALELAPRSLPAILTLGYLRWHQGRADEAREAAALLVAQAPTSKQAQELFALVNGPSR